MQSNDEMIIHINTKGKIFVEDKENGVVKYKAIAADTLMGCIKNPVRTGAVSSGIMPGGSFYYAAGDKGYKKICIEFPSRYCDIAYEKTEYKNFPLPKMVFGFTVSNEKIGNVTLGVVEEGMLKPKSKMYIYPFSNVSGFNVCCGTNRLPNIKSLHQLSGIMYYIMSMPNNNDHYKRERTQLDLELRNLFETLKDKAPEDYYKDILVESGKTLEDFVNA